MAWIRDEINLVSKLKYGLWRLSRNSFPVTLKLKSGSRFILRPRPFRDFFIAQEVFIDKIYRIPSNIAVPAIHNIVDIGANVGFSCVWWLHQYPKASVIAFEPHPLHTQQIHKHLVINSGEERVTIIPKAAGTRSGRMYLTDDEFCSTLVDEHSKNTIAVETTDWFQEIGSKSIDILKVDIEGGEYPLLSDERFATINFKICVLEWHKTQRYDDGCAWCVQRFTELGFRTQLGHTEADNGIIWAFRP